MSAILQQLPSLQPLDLELTTSFNPEDSCFICFSPLRDPGQPVYGHRTNVGQREVTHLAHGDCQGIWVRSNKTCAICRIPLNELPVSWAKKIQGKISDGTLWVKEGYIGDTCTKVTEIIQMLGLTAITLVLPTVYECALGREIEVSSLEHGVVTYICVVILVLGAFKIKREQQMRNRMFGYGSSID